MPELPPRRAAGRRAREISRTARIGAGRWIPLLLLLLSLGVAAVAIIQAQGAVSSHRATADGLLRDYAAFAAWSYRQNVTSFLNGVLHEPLHPVFKHADAAADRRRTGRRPTAADLVAYQDEREREQAAREHGWCSLHYGAGYYFRIPLAGGAPEFAGAAPPPAVRRWIEDAVRTHARGSYRDGQAFAVLSARVGDEPTHVVYTLDGRGETARHAYGYELDPARYERVFDEVLDLNPLLPEALLDGRESRDILSLKVFAPEVGRLYSSGGEAGWGLASEDEFGGNYGGWRVAATVRPEVAGSLIIGGLPRSRLPFLLGLLALSVGLAGVAVYQLRREGELARLRSDFVSSVSHELRTPLAQVRLFLETLRLGRYRTRDQRNWILENMDRETVRLTGLVDNVLHFSRAERGNTGGDLESVDVSEYVSHVVTAFAPLAAARRNQFVTDLEPGLVAPLHRESFRQVLLNLLDNAAKYGAAGQTVTVSSVLAGERVRIVVEDEGPGIAACDRERIWEPFRRGERAIGSVAVGSGIGLSVVREIVEWHGGGVWVEDAAEHGARFVLELPGWRDSEVVAAGAFARVREAV